MKYLNVVKKCNMGNKLGATILYLWINKLEILTYQLFIKDVYLQIYPTNDAGIIGHQHEKKMYLDTSFSSFIKFISKWKTVLSVNDKTIKLLEDNIEEKSK